MDRARVTTLATHDSIDSFVLFAFRLLGQQATSQPTRIRCIVLQHGLYFSSFCSNKWHGMLRCVWNACYWIFLCKKVERKKKPPFLPDLRRIFVHIISCSCFFLSCFFFFLVASFFFSRSRLTLLFVKIFFVFFAFVEWYDLKNARSTVISYFVSFYLSNRNLGILCLIDTLAMWRHCPCMRKDAWYCGLIWNKMVRNLSTRFNNNQSKSRQNNAKFRYKHHQFHITLNARIF